MPSLADSIASLLTLAQQEFGQLTDADKKLFYAVARHEVADFRSETAELNHPESADQWEGRTLKADRIVWLVTTPQVSNCLSFRGLLISGARIEGKLNLEYAIVPVPLIFNACVFSEPPILENAKLKALELKGTHVPGIQADGMYVEGSVRLCSDFVANGSVRLVKARIEGHFNCKKGHFNNPGRIAIDANAATITASIFLDDSFQAVGEVSLMGASIGGQLSCINGKFNNKGNIALNADAARIGADVYLRDNFRAVGQVNLIGASIVGQLDCAGGQFNNPDGIALNADAARIGADVYLRDNFRAVGQVNLRGVSIGGQVDCTRGIFLSKGNIALNADAARIGADVYLRDNFRAVGQVNLIRASIGGLLDCAGGQFYNKGEVAIQAAAATIAADVFFNNRFQAIGEVSLIRTSIGGLLNCAGGRFNNERKVAIQAVLAEIAADTLLCGFKAAGEVNLREASIGGNLDCIGGLLLNKQGYALYAESIKIGGSVFLGEESRKIPFQAEGKVSFLNATINDRFELLSIESSNLESVTLDLSLAKANIFSFSDRQAEQTWIRQIKPGQLRLNGFVYSIVNASNDAIKNQLLLKWVRLQINKEADPQTDDGFALQPYEQLAAVLKAQGHQEAATQVLIAKENDRRRYGGLDGWGKFWNRFLGFTIAHGYRPQRALLGSFAFFLVGCVVFSLGEGLMVQTSDSPKSYAVFNPVAYSFDTFTPVIDLRQESAWLPDASKGKEISLLFFKARCGELLRYYYWVQIVSGWILTSLWVAGFTGLVRSQK